MTTKLQISMDDQLLSRLDDYADRTFNTRSGAIAQAVNQMLLQDEMSRAIRMMSMAMQRIAENNEIDDESKQQLAAFQNLARMLNEGVR